MSTLTITPFLYVKQLPLAQELYLDVVLYVHEIQCTNPMLDGCFAHFFEIAITLLFWT